MGDTEESIEQPMHEEAEENAEETQPVDNEAYDAPASPGANSGVGSPSSRHGDEEGDGEGAAPRSPSPGNDLYDQDAPGSAPASAPGSPDPNAPVSPAEEAAEELTADDNAPASPAVEADETNEPVEVAEEKEGEERASPSPAPAGGDDSDDDEQVVRKKKAALDSDDEDVTQNDEDEEQSSPSKKKRVVMSDDEDDDEEKKDGEGEQDDSPKKKRARIGSDDEEEDGEGEGRGEEEVGQLMANIFGDESDDDDDNNKKDGSASPRRGSGDENEARFGGDDEVDEGPRLDDDPNFEWDFDRMMREKKALNKRKRRRKDGGIDIINDDDGSIAHLVESMKAAAKEDRTSNMDRKPALRKRKMLAVVKFQMMREGLIETLIDGGMMSAISEWLAPLPDKSLPALEIRTEILKILTTYGRLDQGILKQSGLGKAVMLLFKHPRETKENRKMAQKLISEWARPIFQLDTDFRSLTKEERIQRDFDHLPDVRKRRASQDGASSSQRQTGSAQDDLRPGDKGYIGRARVPKPSTKDYVVRPKSNVEGEFKGEKKRSGLSRLDGMTRDFKERTRKHKAQRAVGVSLEGRKMEI